MRNRTIRLFLILAVTVAALGSVQPRSSAMEPDAELRDSELRRAP